MSLIAETRKTNNLLDCHPLRIFAVVETAVASNDIDPFGMTQNGGEK
jgi:hypothetical protein